MLELRQRELMHELDNMQYEPGGPALNLQLPIRRAALEKELTWVVGALAQIDSAEAQRDAVQASHELAAAQREVAASQRELAEAQSAETARREADRANLEDASFWLRRMITWTTVANAAGLAAVLSAVSREDLQAAVNADVIEAAEFFFLGVLAGGLAPLLYWLNTLFAKTQSTLSRAMAGILVIGPAIMFCRGVMTLLGVLRGIYG